MTNLDKYINAFTQLGIDKSRLDGMTYQGIPEWDSLGHLMLINSLEEAFGIRINTDDVINFRSFECGKEILKKYNIEI